jgi:hypothetical protein
MSPEPNTTGLRWDRIDHRDGSPYLVRYHIVEAEAIGVRYHHWLSSDARDPHDHPWDNVTLVLSGLLVEESWDGELHPLHPGDHITRRAGQPHRIELMTADAWTVFVHGAAVRRWGFHTAEGWVHWRDYAQA